jgi:hypothetical protein
MLNTVGIVGFVGFCEERTSAGDEEVLRGEGDNALGVLREDCEVRMGRPPGL